MDDHREGRSAFFFFFLSFFSSFFVSSPSFCLQSSQTIPKSELVPTFSILSSPPPTRLRRIPKTTSMM